MTSCDPSLQLWGLVKQGVKCRDCGIICHKDCKDWVVVDCRKGRLEAKRQKKSSRAQSTATIPAQIDGPSNEDEPCESLEQRLFRTEEVCVCVCGCGWLWCGVGKWVGACVNACISGWLVCFIQHILVTSVRCALLNLTEDERRSL